MAAGCAVKIQQSFTSIRLYYRCLYLVCNEMTEVLWSLITDVDHKVESCVEADPMTSWEHSG